MPEQPLAARGRRVREMGSVSTRLGFWYYWFGFAQRAVDDGL
jgi:hypothetical protein